MGGGRIEAMDERRVGMETHGSDPASGRSSRNGTAGLPQSVPEHYERGSERVIKEFSEGEMELGEVEVGKGERGREERIVSGREEERRRGAFGIARRILPLVLPFRRHLTMGSLVVLFLLFLLFLQLLDRIFIIEYSLTTAPIIPNISLCVWRARDFG